MMKATSMMAIKYLLNITARDSECSVYFSLNIIVFSELFTLQPYYSYDLSNMSDLRPAVDAHPFPKW